MTFAVLTLLFAPLPDYVPAQDLPPVPMVPAPVPPPAPPPPIADTPPVPRGNPAYWVTADDYPARLKFDLVEGPVPFVLDVGADGRVSGCSTPESKSAAALNELTCKLVPRRARFNPATDVTGPVAGTYGNTVRWMLPTWPGVTVYFDPDFLGPKDFMNHIIDDIGYDFDAMKFYPLKARKEGREAEVIVRIAMNDAGDSRNCRIDVPSGQADFDAAACPAMLGLMKDAKKALSKNRAPISLEIREVRAKLVWRLE